MLIPEEEDLLHRKMDEFFHISEIVSTTWGEPFLYNDYVYYFDGFTVYIPHPFGEEDFSILDYVVQKHDPDRIIIYSDEEPPELKGYEKEPWHLEAYKGEFRVRNPKLSKKARKALNRIEKEGIEVIVRREPYYRADTLKLLVKTHDRFSVSWRNTMWYAFYPKVERVRIVELRKDGEIVGAQIVYDNRPRYVCFAEMGYREDVKRASDMVYGAALNLFSNTEILSLGGSKTPSIFEHKKEFFKDPELYRFGDYFWTEYIRDSLEDVDPWYIRMNKKIG